MSETVVAVSALPARFPIKLPVNKFRLPAISRVILLTGAIPDVGEPDTNCRLPPLFVTKSSGDSYICQAFPPNHSIPSLGPGSEMNILFTLFSELFPILILLELPALNVALAGMVMFPFTSIPVLLTESLLVPLYVI